MIRKHILVRHALLLVAILRRRSGRVTYAENVPRHNFQLPSSRQDETRRDETRPRGYRERQCHSARNRYRITTVWS